MHAGTDGGEIAGRGRSSIFGLDDGDARGRLRFTKDTKDAENAEKDAEGAEDAKDAERASSV
jgi:hypothetical protein